MGSSSCMIGLGLVQEIVSPCPSLPNSPQPLERQSIHSHQSNNGYKGCYHVQTVGDMIRAADTSAVSLYLSSDHASGRPVPARPGPIRPASWGPGSRRLPVRNRRSGRPSQFFDHYIPLFFSGSQSRGLQVPSRRRHGRRRPRAAAARHVQYCTVGLCIVLVHNTFSNITCNIMHYKYVLL